MRKERNVLPLISTHLLSGLLEAGFSGLLFAVVMVREKQVGPKLGLK
jgi:hypothetical protein